jgi:hypothetical protein
MKYLLFTMMLFASVFLFNSCDSVTDSKPVSISKPELLSPEDNATNVLITTTFKWNGDADVIEIDINSTFNSPQKRAYTVSGTQFIVPQPLSTNSYYYWHAGNTIGGTTYWSDNYNTFTTGSQ